MLCTCTCVFVQLCVWVCVVPSCFGQCCAASTHQTTGCALFLPQAPCSTGCTAVWPAAATKLWRVAQCGSCGTLPPTACAQGTGVDCAAALAWQCGNRSVGSCSSSCKNSSSNSSSSAEHWWRSTAAAATASCAWVCRTAAKQAPPWQQQQGGRYACCC